MHLIKATEIQPGMFIAGLLSTVVKPRRVAEVRTQHGATRVTFENDGYAVKMSATDKVVRFPAYEALHRVAHLNPDAGEIGPGMLKTIVAEAREVLEWK